MVEFIKKANESNDILVTSEHVIRILEIDVENVRARGRIHTCLKETPDFKSIVVNPQLLIELLEYITIIDGDKDKVRLTITDYDEPLLLSSVYPTKGVEVKILAHRTDKD